MKKSAYTLIEMIIAIVLIGIIGGMTSEIIGKVYENYAIQKELSNLEFKSISILNQIENYIQRSIPNSILLHDGSIAGNGKLDVYNKNKYIDVININNGNLDGNKTLQWLDIDKESLYGDGPNPYYNEWVNLDFSTGNKIVSQNNKYKKIITTEKNIFNTVANPAIYFIYSNNYGTNYQKFYNKTTTTEPTSLFEIDKTKINDNDFELTRIPDEIGELYYITNTGYALQLKDKTLYLIYDFKPWIDNGTGKGETFLDGKKVILSKGITSFDFWVDYNTLRLKICVESNMNIGVKQNNKIEKATLCKERTLGVI